MKKKSWLIPVIHVNYLDISVSWCCDAFVVSRSNVLQESLIKLVEACNDQSHSMDRWLSKLEASNWQTHVKEILTTACLAAQCIDRSGTELACYANPGPASTYKSEHNLYLLSALYTLD